jgi:excisionase family DNA binding protein
MQSGQGANVKTARQIMTTRPATDTMLLTFKEAMDFLRVSRSTIYRLMWSGQLRGHKVGSTWRFYESDLLSAVASPVYEPATKRPAQTLEGQG